MEAKAHVELTLGDVEGVGKKIVNSLHPGHKAQPRYLRRSRNVAAAPAATAVYVTFGSPPVGYFWTVRTVTVYNGLDPFGPLGTTSVALYVGPPPSGAPVIDPATGAPFMSMGDLTVANIVPPATLFFSEHSVYVYPGEEVIAIAFNATGIATAVGANINFTELPMEPIIRPHGPTY